ncbi:peroxidasin homolog [Mytilus edulis]|uniref:peroxidasin homolog n=1 Tax=Mytilus edulis TaxID=6550 RepID=UPI0039EFC2F9
MEKIYSILFIMACPVTVNRCPTLCRCSDTNVNCMSRSLTTVPSNIPSSTTKLYLHRNSITQIDANAFDGLSALGRLHLNNNQSSTLDDNLFRGLTALIGLYLHLNRITTLEINLFKDLTALTTLYLQHNRLTTLDINLFKESTALTTLLLENNPLDCSKCELKTLQEFLQNKTNLYVPDASCDNKPLIDHNFTNCKESETTEAFPSSVATDNAASTTESTTGILKKEVIIFISCGSGFFFILGCSVVCFYVHRKCKKVNITRNVEIGRNTENRAAPENRNAEMIRHISTERGGDHEYANTNELEMSDFVASPSEQGVLSDDDNSSESSNGIRLTSDGYLNPYQALLPAPQQPENSHQESDENSDTLEENRTYTNLYESLESNRREEPHLYARCINEQSLEIKDEPI